MDMHFEQGREKYQRVLAMAHRLPPVLTAVVHPCDEVSLSSAIEAQRLALIKPILVGPPHRLRAVAEKVGLDISDLEIVASEHSHDWRQRPWRWCETAEPRP